MKKGLIALFLFTFLTCVGFEAYSQAPAIAPVSAIASAPVASAPAPAAPIGQSSLSTISSLASKIPDSIPGWVIAVIAFLLELTLRIWPTAQPQSVLLYVATLLGLIGGALTKLSGLLDSVLQNLKTPPSA